MLFLSNTMIVSAPLIAIILLNMCGLGVTHSTDNTTNGIEIYEEDYVNERSIYPNYITPYTTTSLVDDTNESYLMKNKQLNTYFYPHAIIRDWAN